MPEFMPFFKKVSGDLDTPVSVYLKLNQPKSFLLESVTGGEHVARYSYIGFDPLWELVYSNGDLSFFDRGKAKPVPQFLSSNPIDTLESLTKRFKVLDNPAVPPFAGGAVGYFGWEMMAFIEPIIFRDKPGLDVPLMHFMCPGSLVIFDHVTRQLMLVVLAEPHQQEEAQKKLDGIHSQLNQSLNHQAIVLTEKSTGDVFDHVQSTFTQDSYQKAVLKTKDHIFDGDVFQLVLSQQFSLPKKKPPFDVYRSLRLINPSPYMFFWNMDGYQLVGSSPELLVKVQDHKTFLRPIAGTRPRVLGQEEQMITDLLADEKEIAEHVMLVDLGRNDLGRVCQFQSIQVSKLLDVEKYSHVIHLVSTVEGKLLPEKSAFDVFKATFPAGTLSGAPKIRAVEIIDQLEPQKRGCYGGALGYIDRHGNMDLCIIIRTILSFNDTYYIQAGAGLVADSHPETEFYESRNKARGMVQACLE
jgi:anthranilate synthase component 1